MAETQNPTYYAIIPANVRYDSNLSSSEKLFYGEITVLTNKTGDCWASNSYFSKIYNVSPSTISAWVGKLERFGYIKVRYEREGKQITKRIMKLVDGQNIDYPIQSGQKMNKGLSENLNTPIQNIDEGYSENLQENSINSNNIKDNIINANSTEAGWDKDFVDNKIIDILRDYDIHPEDKRFITALEYYKEAGSFDGVANIMEWDTSQKNNWWKVLGRFENV